MVANSLAQRYLNAIKRRGILIALRQTTTLPGPEAQPNPPTLVNPTVAANASQGAFSIGVVADSAIGRLIVGDSITVNGLTYQVDADVTANTTSPAGFNVVTLQQPLAASMTAGDPITMTWAADLPVWAMINSFPFSQQDGTLVLARDLRVTISSYGIPEPDIAWRVVFGERDYSIVSKTPTYAMGCITGWQLQAR
jgi:hypothetical protein